jgi:hypothetical protein
MPPARPAEVGTVHTMRKSDNGKPQHRGGTGQATAATPFRRFPSWSCEPAACLAAVNSSGRDPQLFRGAAIVPVLGRKLAVALLCALLRPAPQLGSALAPQVLQVDVVALYRGECQIQVDGKACPIDLVSGRRLATDWVVTCGAAPQPTPQWAEGLPSVPTGVVRSQARPFLDCATKSLCESCDGDVSPANVRGFRHITVPDKPAGRCQ